MRGIVWSSEVVQAMKCPECGERLTRTLRGMMVCRNRRCRWIGDAWRLSEPKPLGETVYWKPVFRGTLNRVTVGAILHRGEVENGREKDCSS